MEKRKTGHDRRWADAHMHTPLCGHAWGEPREYVDQAARAGLATITFTCHIPTSREDLFCGRGMRMHLSQLPHYAELIADAKTYAEPLGIEVLYGIEAEIFPDKEVTEEVASIVRSQPFDFVLGSLHHPLPGYQSWLEEQGLREDAAIVEAYFGTLADAAHSGLYDSLAHPDVIRIYGTVEPFHPRDHETTIREFLLTCAEVGQAIEVNTSGLIKECFDLHPHPVMLQWAKEAGVAITLGSDSHLPERPGHPFEEVVPLLQKTGFTQALTFRQRQPLPFTL